MFFLMFIVVRIGYGSVSDGGMGTQEVFQLCSVWRPEDVKSLCHYLVNGSLYFGFVGMHDSASGSCRNMSASFWKNFSAASGPG